MADLLISPQSPGVALATSVDPFDRLAVWRIERSQWAHTPHAPGIYLLHGVHEGQLKVYIGMSQTSMRNRVKTHHVTAAKNWFGVLFAVPVPDLLLCPAIEAELIGQLEEAQVVEVIDNKATESRHRGSQDVHVLPAVEKLKSALQLLLGADIFEPAEVEETAVTVDPVVPRADRYARVYRGAAEAVRDRTDQDPSAADHALVGSSATAYGKFVGAEPDTHFRVLAGSEWRQASPEGKSPSTAASLQRLAVRQQALVEQGVLDADSGTFARDWEADNWSQAARVCAGQSSYSGGWHWQRLGPVTPGVAVEAEPAKH